MNINKQIEQKIMTLYNQNYSVYYISVKVDVPIQTIYRIVEKNEDKINISAV